MLVIARAPTDRGDERRPLMFDATQLSCLFYESITLSLARLADRAAATNDQIVSQSYRSVAIKGCVLPLCSIFRINVNSNDMALFWLIAIVGAVDKDDAPVEQGKP